MSCNLKLKKKKKKEASVYYIKYGRIKNLELILHERLLGLF